MARILITSGPTREYLDPIRYLTNAHLWGGAGYVVLGADDPEPWAQIWSSYQAVWTRNETNIDPARVESPGDVIARTAELARGYAEKSKRVGIVNMSKLMSMGEHVQFSAHLQGYEIVEATAHYNAIRQIKTAGWGTVVDQGKDVIHMGIGNAPQIPLQSIDNHTGNPPLECQVEGCKFLHGNRKGSVIQPANLLLKYGPGSTGGPVLFRPEHPAEPLERVGNVRVIPGLQFRD